MSTKTLIAIMLVPVFWFLFRRYVSGPLERLLLRKYGHFRLVRFLTKERDGL